MKRVGIFGYGTIGKYLVEKLQADAGIEIAFVVDPFVDAEQAQSPAPLYKELDEALLREVDLVVEAATAVVVRTWAPVVLKHADMLVFSATAFADSDFHDEVLRVCEQHNRRLYIPHGAILGLDGISDGRETIQSVRITTTKSPKSLGRTDTERAVVYDGPTRGACREYPRNVNVHAGVALAALGFDRTHSTIVSDPAATTNSHLIEVDGDGIVFKIEVASKPMGLVTGVYTPASAYGSVRKILSVHSGVQIV